MEKAIKVEGMMCMHCVAHALKGAEELPGVTAEVDLDGGRAVVRAGASGRCSADERRHRGRL